MTDIKIRKIISPLWAKRSDTEFKQFLQNKKTETQKRYIRARSSMQRLEKEGKHISVARSRKTRKSLIYVDPVGKPKDKYPTIPFKKLKKVEKGEIGKYTHVYQFKCKTSKPIVEHYLAYTSRKPPNFKIAKRHHNYHYPEHKILKIKYKGSLLAKKWNE